MARLLLKKECNNQKDDAKVKTKHRNLPTLAKTSISCMMSRSSISSRDILCCDCNFAAFVELRSGFIFEINGF